MEAQQYVSALREVAFCAALPDAAVAALARIAAPIRYPAGSVIQLEGDPAVGMYVVVAGRVKIARIASGGREQVLYVVGPGSHFNTVAVFDGGTCPANAETSSDVDLLLLPGAALRQVVSDHPTLALALLREFTGRLRHLIGLVDDLALHSVQGRLASLLLAQAEAAEHGAAYPLTQAEIAARIGTVREMVGRTLRAFEGMGLISVERGTIVVLDRAGLAREAEA